jgi:GT2 family glycosyltransferase
MTPRGPAGSAGSGARGSLAPGGVRISVITVTRQRRELLLRKAATLERQSLPPRAFEWVVCDNGSDDGTAEALQGLSLPFELKVVRLPVNLGPGPGRNACVAASSGGLLYLSDDDCLLEPDTLERHLEAQRAPCVAVGGVRWETATAHEYLRPRRVRYWNLHGMNTSLPRAEFDRVGGFAEGLTGYGHEDVLFGYELHRRGVPLRALPEVLVRHIGGNPMSSGDLDKARSAGRNAALIVRRYPALRFRLGVHPLLLRLKLALLPSLAAFAGPRLAGEIAYSRAAWEALSVRAAGGEGGERG